MELLTNSSRSMYQECPRRFQYMYEMGYKPNTEAHALVFGTAMHKMLEQYYLGTEPYDVVSWLMSAQEEVIAKINAFDKVKLRELFNGYVRKWGRPEKVLAVELQFELPLINVETSTASRTFLNAGKIDAIIEQNGNILVTEHKTTSMSIDNPTADYWLKLAIDSQISGYFVAAEKHGYSPSKILYDVIGKPSLKPKFATPENERKYTKKGELYANQRTTDETPEEYAERLRDDILQFPDSYYQRKEVPRLDIDLIEYSKDMWAVSKMILHSRANNFYPKRTSQCFNMGRCSFYSVCAKIACLEDTSIYTRDDNKNPELEQKKGEDTHGF